MCVCVCVEWNVRSAVIDCIHVNPIYLVLHSYILQPLWQMHLRLKPLRGVDGRRVEHILQSADKNLVNASNRVL